MKKPIQYCWSYDEENFIFNALGELIDDLRTDYNDSEMIGRTVYKAECRLPTPKDLIDVDDIFQIMSERAWDFANDYAEDYPDCTKEAADRLQKYLYKWMEKECKPNLWQVVNVREYVITEDDLE